MILLSPRQALQNLLRVLDEIEQSKCPICMKPSTMTDECAKHDPKFGRALRDAVRSLEVKDD